MKNVFIKIALLFVVFISFAHAETVTKTWTTGAYHNNSYLQHRLSIDNTSTVTIKGETEKDHDFIYIYDSHNKLVGKFSGTINKTLTINGSAIRAILKSNGSVNKSGVTVTLTSGGETKTWTTGAYGKNSYLQHRLSIDKTSTVTVKGETEKDHDFIRIYDSHNKLVGRFSGNIDETLTISGSAIKAILKSNGSVTGNGVTVTLTPDS